MTVLSVFVGQPKPGRFDDAVGISRQAMKVVERHGAKNNRILTGFVSGAAFGSIVNSSELEDMEAWGAWVDALMADDETVGILGQLRGEHAPYTTQSAQVVTEIPLGGRKRGPNGAIVATYMSAPVPGRYQAALALGEQGAELLERHGGRNCRLFAQQANGLQPDVLVSTAEYDTLRAYGKAMNSFLADAAGQAIVTLTQSSDSPVRLLSSDIYTEMPG
jgi:hypothetical protein